MGIFDSISNAINEGKQKALMESASFERKIEYYKLREACELAVRELNKSSVPKKLGITDVIKKKIKAVADQNDQDQLYDAFECMYDMQRRKGDVYAINLSKWIGKILYDMGDRRIESNDEGNFYRPVR